MPVDGVDLVYENDAPDVADFVGEGCAIPSAVPSRGQENTHALHGARAVVTRLQSGCNDSKHTHDADMQAGIPHG